MHVMWRPLHKLSTNKYIIFFKNGTYGRPYKLGCLLNSHNKLFSCTCRTWVRCCGSFRRTSLTRPADTLTPWASNCACSASPTSYPPWYAVPPYCLWRVFLNLSLRILHGGITGVKAWVVGSSFSDVLQQPRSRRRRETATRDWRLRTGTGNPDGSPLSSVSNAGLD